jgi:biotin transporter BioY
MFKIKGVSEKSLLFIFGFIISPLIVSAEAFKSIDDREIKIIFFILLVGSILFLVTAITLLLIIFEWFSKGKTKSHPFFFKSLITFIIFLGIAYLTLGML